MSFWKTEGADDLLKKLRADGKSFSQCAAEISFAFKHKVSRNACISRASRNGMAIVNVKRQPGVKRSPIRAKKQSALSGLPISPLPPAHDYDVPRIAFADLDPHHCRFPVGEPTAGFCGHQKVEGLAYCEVHSRRCYTPATPRSERLRDFHVRRIVGFTPKVFEDA